MTEKTSVAYRLSQQAINNLDRITAATGATKTATVETALALMANQLSLTGEKTMKINKNSARQVARNLFALEPQSVAFYVEPKTGELEYVLAGEIPSEGYEYLCSRTDGSLSGWGQEYCETDEELEKLFEQAWENFGDEWISELEEHRGSFY